MTEFPTPPSSPETNLYNAPEAEAMDEPSHVQAQPAWPAVRYAWQLPLLGIFFSMILNAIARGGGSTAASVKQTNPTLSLIGGGIALVAIVTGFVYTVIGFSRLPTHRQIKGHVIGGAVVNGTILVMIVLVVLAVGTQAKSLAFGPPTESWPRIQSTHSLFSVTMPGNPSPSRRDIEGQNGSVRLFLQTYEKPGLLFFLNSSEMHLPEVLEKANPDGREVLGSLMNGVLEEQPGAKMLKHRELKLQGHPALEATYRMKLPQAGGDLIQITNRWVWHNKKVYALQFGTLEKHFVSHPDRLAETQKAFFDSLRIPNRPSSN